MVRYWTTYRFIFKRQLDPEDGNFGMSRNVGKRLPFCNAQNPKRPQMSFASFVVVVVVIFDDDIVDVFVVQRTRSEDLLYYNMFPSTQLTFKYNINATCFDL